MGAAWASEALAESIPPPGIEPWQPLTFRSIPTRTRYASRQDATGRVVLEAESRCGASGWVLRFEESIDLDRTPRLAWRWRVTRPLDAGTNVPDERTRAGDDFAARVYVLFPFDPERASLRQRLERAIGERLYGAELPGPTLNYVWPRAVPRGTAWTSPVRDEARLVAIESPIDGAPNGRWHEAIVDLHSDARARLGLEPGIGPVGIGVMTDADDTCGEAEAAYADFRWLGPAGESSEPIPRERDDAPSESDGAGDAKPHDAPARR